MANVLNNLQKLNAEVLDMSNVISVANTNNELTDLDIKKFEADMEDLNDLFQKSEFDDEADAAWEAKIKSMFGGVL